MIRIAGLAALAALAATPALAALKAGDKAPDFTAQAYQAGKPFSYKLSDALKKGPVVVYFFPAAHTKGCNLEAHLFSEAVEDFRKEKASVIGVTAGNVDQLAAFSSETEHCGGKFPVAADPNAAIARSYDAILKQKPDWSSRTSYVIAPDGTVIHAYDNLAPNDHVAQTLEAVKSWKSKK
jgi:thioredoxin-dependent peroxiredoxin